MYSLFTYQKFCKLITSTPQQRAKTRNRLQRILEFQQFYQSVRIEGVPDSYIYEKHIKNKYHYSYRTMLSWLKTNAQKQLKQLEKTP